MDPIQPLLWSLPVIFCDVYPAAIIVPVNSSPALINISEMGRKSMYKQELIYDPKNEEKDERLWQAPWD